MSEVMLTIGSLSLYKSALVIALGAAACFALMYALYISHGGFGPAAVLLLQIAAGMLLYTGFSFLLNRRTMTELLEVFRRRKTGEAQEDKGNNR